MHIKVVFIAVLGFLLFSDIVFSHPVFHDHGPNNTQIAGAMDVANSGTQPSVIGNKYTHVPITIIKTKPKKTSWFSFCNKILKLGRKKPENINVVITQRR